MQTDDKRQDANPHDQGLGRRSEEILIALRREIDEGVFPRGAKLPTEMALCERFGVTRPTVRRAVARLAAEGRVQVRHGAGMYVLGGGTLAADRRTISVMYPFEGDELLDVQSRALSKGYLLSVFTQARSGWDVKAERAFLELVLKERHAGLLAFCSPTAPRNDELLRRLAAGGVRVIHIEHFREQPPQEEYILPDYRKAGHMAAVAMMLAGYRRVVFLGLNLESPYSRLMEAGAAEALQEHGNGYDRATQCLQFPTGIQQSDEARRQLKARIKGLGGETGIVCNSTGLAGRTCDMLREWGLAVPRDFGIAGPQLIGGRPDLEPGVVDTLEFPRTTMLRRALARITDPDSLPMREWISPQWVRRGTIRFSITNAASKEVSHVMVPRRRRPIQKFG